MIEVCARWHRSKTTWQFRHGGSKRPHTNNNNNNYTLYTRKTWRVTAQLLPAGTEKSSDLTNKPKTRQSPPDPASEPSVCGCVCVSVSVCTLITKLHSKPRPSIRQQMSEIRFKNSRKLGQKAKKQKDKQLEEKVWEEPWKHPNFNFTVWADRSFGSRLKPN